MRYQDWDIKLAEFIKSRKDMPFQWGSNDCVMFAVNCAEAMTGVDLAEKYNYSTLEGAQEIIKNAGGFKELVNLNMKNEISPKLARRGDWVLIQQQDGTQALAVCIGSVVIAAGKDGLVQRPMSEAITAWRIE